MTREQYIVKNCPCLFNSYYASGKTVRFECNDGNHDDKLCRDVTDCVIKQVIERCKENLSSLETYIDIRSYECTMLQDILDLFNIEEINK